MTFFCDNDAFSVVVEAPDAFAFLGPVGCHVESALRLVVQHFPENGINGTTPQICVDRRRETVAKMDEMENAP